MVVGIWNQCGWCLRLEESEGVWSEPLKEKIHLLNGITVSHGICEKCEEIFFKNLTGVTV